MSGDLGLTWQELHQRGIGPAAHSGASLMFLDKKLLLMGGFCEAHINTIWEGTVNQMEITWDWTVTPPWKPRYCHRVANLGPLILLTGGHGAEGDFSET